MSDTLATTKNIDVDQSTSNNKKKKAGPKRRKVSQGITFILLVASCILIQYYEISMCIL